MCHISQTFSGSQSKTAGNMHKLRTRTGLSLNYAVEKPIQGSTLTHDRPTLSACCSVRSGWTRQIQAQLLLLISYQHLSFINSIVYDCKLTFSLVERMIVLDDCLLFYHIRYERACVTSPGNPA